MMRRASLAVSAGFLLFNCSHELEGEGKSTVEDTTLTYCGADEQGFVIRGTNLSPMVVDGATEDARVDLPDVCMTRVEDVDGNAVSGEPEVCIPEEDVSWVSTSELHFTVRSGLGLAPGVYDVVIRNPDGSEASGTIRITILAEGPLLFWSDPNVVYNGIATQGTIYGSGIGDIEDVSMRDADGQESPLEFQTVGTRDNRVQVIVPSGTAEGEYDVVVHTTQGCAAELLRGIRVTSTVDLEVTGIDPSFGWSEGATPVTITGSEFAPVPRVFLNPMEATEDTVATALASVALVSDERLTAVVPAGLPTGLYDVVVVNPDGRVGLIEAEELADNQHTGFSVTEDDPPVVNSVSPNYVDNSAPQTVTISGANFDAPFVSLACRGLDGTESSLEGTVAADGTASSIEVSLPVEALAQGTVCIVRVTNADGSYFEYSAVGISNPSSNLNDFVEAPDLITARRAPAVSAQRATRSARFVYAIGGDDGNVDGALRSVETTPIDIYGEAGDWFEQPVRLPDPRTLAGVARVGRFMYVVGGNDGAGPTTSVVRAQVLDPLDAPEIVDVVARQGEDDGEGVGAGVWYYRVSAVMSEDDPSNPGGETLASDPIGVSLPVELEGTLVLTLFWDPVPGAMGYRIYRSPSGSENLDGVRLLAEVDGGDTTTYEDTAVGGADLGDPPLPLGATGVWMGMPDLGTAREAAGVAVAQDPDDADTFHIYAIGGRDSDHLATWERLSVVVADDGTHEVDAWVAGDADISSARSELTAFAVSHTEAFNVPAGATYIYAGGGTGAGNDAANVDVALVAPGGDLTWAAADAMSPARSGYAGLAGAGFLFAFGGAQGAASDSNASAELDPAAVPDLVNWNNEGVRLLTPRYLAGSSEESAFIYVVGGDSGSGATASVERTVL